MLNWNNAKSKILTMSLEEKRRLYKCRDRFKTVTDIIDWRAYVRTDEGAAKLSSSYRVKDSQKKDGHSQTDKPQCDSPMTSKNVTLDDKTNTDKDNRVDQSENVKDSAADKSSISRETSKAKLDVISGTTSTDESMAADKSLKHVDSKNMEIIGTGESKTSDEPTISKQDPKLGVAGTRESKASDEPTTSKCEFVDKSTTTEGTDKQKVDVTRGTTTTNEDEASNSPVLVIDEGEAALSETETEKKFRKNDFLNAKISLFTGDITCLEIDAIVNAANEELYCGGGVDNAIHTAAGYAFLRSECDALGGCDTGDAKITGGYKLPAKYIIHAVGPKGEYPDLLRSCYNRAMDLLKEHELETIAFPCISTGIYGYPNENAANVALETIRNWLEENENAYGAKVKRVIFCLFLQRDIDIYYKLMPKYFPFE